MSACLRRLDERYRRGVIPQPKWTARPTRIQNATLAASPLLDKKTTRQTENTMAVMVTLTLKTDAATYQRLHAQLMSVARPAGLLFHSGREVPGGIAIVDYWPSREAFQGFMEGPAAEGMKASGIPAPDDIEFTPVLTAE